MIVTLMTLSPPSCFACRKSWARGAALLAMMTGGVAHAAVNEVFPADYTALPEGTLTTTYYLFHREFSGPYANDKQLMGGNLRSDLAALRMVKFLKAGDYTVAPMMVLPVSDIHASGASLPARVGDKASGFGDLRLGTTLWLINEPAKRHYFGVTGILFAPTGAYRSDRVLNIGENRWKFALNMGWIGALSEKWTLDLAPEFIWYGSNDNYAKGAKLEQKTSLAFTAYLRHHLGPSTQLFVGGQLNDGGETVLNGTAQRNEVENPRFYLGLTHLLSATSQVVARYGRDTAIHSGFKTDHEFALRLLKLY